LTAFSIESQTLSVSFCVAPRPSALTLINLDKGEKLAGLERVVEKDDEEV